MLIRVGYEIAFSFPQPTAMVVLLYVHPSLAWMVRTPERFEMEPRVPISEFVDSFGNRCGRLFVPAGRVVLRNDATVEDSEQPDPQAWNAPQHDVQDLPNEVLLFLLAHRSYGSRDRRDKQNGCVCERMILTAWYDRAWNAGLEYAIENT